MTAPFDRTTHLPVNETFGPVQQGEGPHVGRPVSFIRLGHCNLSCKLCDTPQTWDTTRFVLDATCPPRHVEDLLLDVNAYGAPTIVLSGGEPLMWQNTVAWNRLLTTLDRQGFEIHVETNGTITPNPETIALVNHWSVSPKLDALGTDPEKKRIKPKVLAAFADLAVTGRAALKIVCETENDVYDAAEFGVSFGFPRSRIWVMPEGTTVEKTTSTSRTLAEPAARAHVNLSPRLHVQTGTR